MTTEEIADSFDHISKCFRDLLPHLDYVNRIGASHAEEAYRNKANKMRRKPNA